MVIGSCIVFLALSEIFRLPSSGLLLPNLHQMFKTISSQPWPEQVWQDWGE
jgi:hypothetical protein